MGRTLAHIFRPLAPMTAQLLKARPSADGRRAAGLAFRAGNVPVVRSQPMSAVWWVVCGVAWCVV
jgi:hypothetical protein